MIQISPKRVFGVKIAVAFLSPKYILQGNCCFNFKWLQNSKTDSKDVSPVTLLLIKHGEETLLQ